jgi:hypothetical protein
VKILPDLELIIQSNPTRWLPKVDPHNRETILSIGCFWENLCQAAAVSGFKTQTNIIAQNTKDTNILKVKLTKSPPQHPNILTSMETRTTNRKKYKKQELQPAHLKECKKLLPKTLFYFPRQSQTGKWLALNSIKAMKKQAFDDEKQQELAEWLRFSRAQALSRGDGITAEMLGLTGIVKLVWYGFMNEKSALSRMFRNGAVKAIKNQVNSCSGFFVITSDDFSIPSLLHAGREFQRLCLKCTDLKIETHAISQLIQESPWKDQLPGSLDLPGPVQFILCIGYSKRGRRPHPLARPKRAAVINAGLSIV